MKYFDQLHTNVKCKNFLEKFTIKHFRSKVKIHSFYFFSKSPLYYFYLSTNSDIISHKYGWLVGCFGCSGPLRQYFSLYRAVSQREGERGEKGQMREKMSQQPPPTPTASATGPCPTIIQISRTPRHWKFTQHLRTTRPPPTQICPNTLLNSWDIMAGVLIIFLYCLVIPKQPGCSI